MTSSRRGGGVHRDDVDPRRHHLGHGGVRQREDAEQHVALGGAGVAGRDGWGSDCALWRRPSRRGGGSGRSGASVAAAPRRAGRVQLGRDRRDEPRQQVADDPDQPDRGNQPDEPAHRRAGPPGHRRARRRRRRAPAARDGPRAGGGRASRPRPPAARSPPSARGRSASDSAASASHAAHRVSAAATSGARKSCRKAITPALRRSAPAGATSRIGCAPAPSGWVAAERVQRPVDHQADQLLAQRHAAGLAPRAPATQGQM